MNPEWNTPPGGDFVRYVEQLTARALATASRPGAATMLLDDEVPAPPAAARGLERPRPATAFEAAGRKPDAGVAAKRPASLGLKLLIGWAVVVALFASGKPGLWGLALVVGALWFVATRLKRILAGFAGSAQAEALRRQAARRKLPN